MPPWISGEDEAPRFKPLLERDRNSWHNDLLNAEEIVVFGWLFAALMMVAILATGKGMEMSLLYLIAHT